METNWRTIFIGDIHWCYKEFKLLLKKLQLSPQDKVYLTWDLINKWPKSFKVVKFIYEHQNQFKSVIGNNEINFFNWLNWEKYIESKEIFKKLKRKFDEYPKILDFLKNLPKYIEKDNFILVHWWVINNKKIEDHSLDEVTRIREINWMPWYNLYHWNKKIIYWHYALDWLRIREKTIGIDSSCVYWNKLTAYILETWKIIQQKALDTYIEVNSKKYLQVKISQLKKFQNHKIAILWFWKEGKSTLNFLLKFGLSNITILDKNNDIEKKENLNYILWEKYIDNLDDFDLIIKAPWISPYNEKIFPYKYKITTQANIFFDNYKWKIIWITWTKGKSTTSTLIYKTLKEIWYKVKLVWNIWNPVLDEVDFINNDTYDYIIFELSSYMLELLKPRLYIWVLNNLYSCHFDWHNGKENYQTAKYNIIRHSNYKLANYELKSNINVNKLNNLEYFWENWKYYYKNWLFYIWEQQVLKDKNILLQWEHNRKNISVVIWVLNIIDSKNISHNINILQKVLGSFNGLEHRIQNIWTYKWITFIDDAIATTPESTIAAIKTFWEKIWTLFLWWQDSWFQFETLVDTIKKYKIKNIVLFPDTWEKIFWDLSNYNYWDEFKLSLWNNNINILKTKSMEKAVSFAYKNTWTWKICILSNAAPSFSLWSGFIEKWNLFQNEVKKQSLL